MISRIRKVIGAILLITALVITQIPALQVSATDPDYQLDGETLVKYTGSGEIIEIPASVKIIGEEAFADNDNIETIILNDNIKEIRYQAFYDCDNLKTVETGNKCKVIGNGAFADCDNLTSVSLGASVKDFGSAVFAGDNKLETINLSPDNTNLQYASGAIYNDDATHLFELLSGSKSPSYYMPDTVETVDKYAFWGCDNLQYVELSAVLDSIPAYAFSNCRNLEMLTVPFSANMIGPKAFENCSNLKAIEIPDSVRYIHETAFDGCDNLNIIASPYSIAGQYAANHKYDVIEKVEYEELLSSFLNRLEENLKELEEALLSITPEPSDATQISDIPGADEKTDEAELTSTPDGSFQPVLIDPNIETIEKPQGIRPTELPTESVSVIPDNQNNNGQSITVESGTFSSSIVSDNAVLFVDNTTQKVYQGGIDTPLSYDDIIEQLAEENNVEETEIANEYPELIIGSASNKKGLYIPKYTVFDNQIADHAFYGNTAMNGFDFPDNIYTIGEFSFARTAIKSISIPNTVKNIEFGAFYHCGDLENVSIPTSVETIDSYAFAATKWLNDFYNGREVPSDITNDDDFLIVGDGILLAYRGNNVNVVIPSSVKTIGNRAFAEHPEIINLFIPDSVTQIGNEAFYKCSGLTSVSFGNNVDWIHDRAFAKCPLVYIKLPKSVTKIGIDAFNLSDTVQKNKDGIIEFTSEELPVVTYDNNSTKYYSSSDRTLCLPNTKYAIVPSSNVNLENSILDPHFNGYRGLILTWVQPDSININTNESNEANEESDSALNASVNESYLTVLKNTVLKQNEAIPNLDDVPSEIAILNKNYILTKDSQEINDYYVNYDWGTNTSELGRINLTVNSTVFTNSSNADIHIPGNRQTLYVDINDDQNAAQKILDAYHSMYTNSNVFTIDGFDISAKDQNGIPIKDYGSSYMTISLIAPEKYQNDNCLLYLLTLDKDGQLETVPSRIIETEDGHKLVEFEIRHMSPYAFICFNEEYSTKMAGKLDSTPDTGDNSGLYTKWFLFAGLSSLGLLLILRKKRV